MNTDSRRRILIADDDPHVRLILESRLGAMGYDCVTVESGVQAIARFKPDDVDLVISDLNMPHGDGADLAAAIRRVSGVPLILISGFKDAFRKRMRGIPDVMFLHKPFETRELVELVRSAIGSPPARGGQETQAGIPGGSGVDTHG